MEANKPPGLENECYLGDGAYVGTEGESVVLWTTDGIRVTNIIYLEPSVMLSLEGWFKRLSHE